MAEVRNYDGSIVTQPAKACKARSVDDIQRVMPDDASYPSTVRAMGRYHSLTPCVSTPGTIVVMSAMKSSRGITVAGRVRTGHWHPARCRPYAAVVRLMARHGVAWLQQSISLGAWVDNTAGRRCSVVAARTGLTDRVCEASPAARALAVKPFGQCRKRGGLRNCHDCLERERSAMGVVTKGDSSRGMAKDLDR
jgi:hypothetical protein